MLHFYNFTGKDIIVMGEDGVITNIPHLNNKFYYVYEENHIRDSFGLLDRIPVKLYYMQALPKQRENYYVLLPEIVYNLLTDIREDVICIRDAFYSVEGFIIDDTCLSYNDKHKLIDILFNKK